jgi:hypothetical protein
MMTMNTTMSLYNANILPDDAPEYDLHLYVEQFDIDGNIRQGWSFLLLNHGDALDADPVGCGPSLPDEDLLTVEKIARLYADQHWHIDDDAIVDVQVHAELPE